MNASPFRNVILPALMTASTSFAVLTTPAVSHQVTQLAASLPPTVGSWLAPNLGHANKDVSIRYVGFAILVGVLTGAGTVEVMRSRQARRQRRQSLLQTMAEASHQGQPTWADTVAQVEGRLGPTPAPASMVAATALPGWIPMAEWATAEPSPGPAAAAPDAKPEASGLDWGALLQLPVQSPPAAVTPPPAVTSAPALATHRIRLGADQPCLLAIQVEGEYYSFHRQCPTAQKAETLAAQLQQRGQATVITADDRGHTLWVHQPQADLDQPDWSPTPLAS